MKLRKLAAQLGLEPACALVVAELWAGASKRKELRLSSTASSGLSFLSSRLASFVLF
jgi:hypothetical protein